MEHLVCVISNAPTAPADYGSRLCSAVAKAMNAKVSSLPSGDAAAKALPGGDQVHELDVVVKRAGLSVMLRSATAGSWRASDVKTSDPVGISVSDTQDMEPAIAALVQALPFLLQSRK